MQREAVLLLLVEPEIHHQLVLLKVHLAVVILLEEPLVQKILLQVVDLWHQVQ